MSLTDVARLLQRELSRPDPARRREGQMRTAVQDGQELRSMYREYQQALRTAGVPPRKYKIAIVGKTEKPADFIHVLTPAYVGEMMGWPGPLPTQLSWSGGQPHMPVIVAEDLFWAWSDQAADLMNRGSLQFDEQAFANYCGLEMFRRSLVQCLIHLLTNELGRS